MLMASACWTTPAEPTPNIDATVEAQVKQKVAATVEAQVKQKVASTVEAMSPTTSPQISLPTPVPDDLIHVGETIEKQIKVYGPNKLSHLYISTIEIQYRGWSEETIAVAGPYNSGYYSFNALPGKKFVVLIFDVKNTGSREAERPDISGVEILTEPHGDYFDGWRLTGGIRTKGYAARKSTPEEIEQFAPWSGWYGASGVEIVQRQTVQLTAIFEILEDASPVQAEVTGFDRPLGFD